MADRIGKLVKVIWTDTSGIGRWTNKEYFAEDVRPVDCTSVGWIISESNTHLNIAASRDDSNNNVNDGNAIPKSCVVKVTSLIEQGSRKRTRR